MLNAVRDAFDALLGRREYAVTIPVMDGPFLPNHALETAETVVAVPSLDDLTVDPAGLYLSSGGDLMLAVSIGDAAAPQCVDSYPRPIACIAADGAGGLAVGLDGGGVIIRGGRHDGRRFEPGGGATLNCPNAALFLDPDTLIVTNGAADRTQAEWKHDLMGLGCSGSVWRLDLNTGKAALLSDRLAFPYGLARGKSGDIFVSESWKHRVVSLAADRPSRPRVRISNLPGYPSRITPAEQGGYFLALFAARNQLVEFVLRERRYCERMMRDVDPEYWVAPAYSSGLSFKEQIQGDSVKMMGILKPWAPPRSYGLVALCDGDMQPVASWHSRADGTAHAVTSVVEFGGALIVGSRGGGRAVRLDVPVAQLLESM